VEVADPRQSGASLERPGMDRVRDLVAEGGESVVLAQDRDRFAREFAYHHLLKREFGEYGSKLKALNDRGTVAQRVSSPTASLTSSPSSSGRKRRSEHVVTGYARPGRAKSLRLSPEPRTDSDTTPRGTATS
jgi:hypothetical protein